MQSTDAAYCYRCCMQWCVCVYAGYTGELCKHGWTDRDAVWESESCEPKEPHISRDPHLPMGSGYLWGGHVLAYCNIPMHECILYCSSAATGECACPAHTADICICHHDHEEWQDGNGPFAKLLWSLITWQFLFSYFFSGVMLGQTKYPKFLRRRAYEDCYSIICYRHVALPNIQSARSKQQKSAIKLFVQKNYNGQT